MFTIVFTRYSLYKFIRKLHNKSSVDQVTNDKFRINNIFLKKIAFTEIYF